MPEVSIRELRNHGGDIVDRAAKGERLIIPAPENLWPSCDRSVGNRYLSR